MPIENSILYDESINLQCHEIWVLICSKNARNLTSLLMFLIAIMYLKSFRRPNTPRSSIAFNMVSSITYVILWHSSSVCVALNCSILSTSRYISESWQLLSDSMFFIQNSFIAGSGCIISKFLFSAVSFLNALICCCNFLLSSRITKTSDICNSRYSDESVLGITFFSISTITHRYELSILRIRIHMDFLISDLKLLATSIKSSMST